MQDCSILVLTCKNNGWIFTPFMHLFKKHWPGETVHLVAEKNYSNSSSVNFIQVPDNLMVRGECPPKFFSNQLIWALRQAPTKYVIILLADYWLYKPVLLEPLNASLEYMKAHQDVLRIDIAERPRSGDLKALSENIFECATVRDCFHPVSLTPGLWNKEHYLTILKDNFDPWRTELYSYKQYLERTDLKSLWCEPGAIHYTNVQRGRDNTACVVRREWIDEMRHYIPDFLKLHFEN